MSSSIAPDPRVSSVVYPYQPFHTPQYVVIIDCLLLATIIITGIFGNLLIFITILTDKRLLNQSNMLVMNIAFADILVMAFILPVVIGNVITNGSVLGQAACTFASCVVVVTCAVSIVSMASISINRYIFICRHHIYNTYFSRKNTVWLIVTMWTFWILVVGVTAIWQPHYYNPDSWICIFDHQTNLFFTAFLMGFGIGVPAVITFVCYYKIWCKVADSQRAMRQHTQVATIGKSPTPTAADTKKQARKRRENRATAALFVAFMCFLVFWGPYGVAAVIYYFQRLPQYTIKYLSWLGMSNSCVNSIVYGAMNKNFRDGYVRILSCGRKRSVLNGNVVGAQSASNTDA